MSTEPSDDSLDVPLWGARAIARAANVNERRAWNLLERGLLPAVKIGKIWCTSKRRLLGRIEGSDGFTPPIKPEPVPPPHVPKSRKRKLRRRVA